MYELWILLAGWLAGVATIVIAVGPEGAREIGRRLGVPDWLN